MQPIFLTCFCFVGIFKLICTHAGHLQLADVGPVDRSYSVFPHKLFYPNDVQISLFDVGI